MIEANENLSASYMKMSENALGTMNREKEYNLAFSISACYYSMYYALYSIMMKIGVKCEIHSCTIEIMKVLLDNYYSKEDVKTISKAFDLRNLAQYYVDKVLNKKDINFIFMQAPLFVNHSKNILSSINEKDVGELRNNFESLMKQ